MKGKKIFIELLLLGVACICKLNAWAATEVDVTKAGTLSTLMQDIQVEKELKVTGVINGTDIKYIRSLVTAGTVTKLDWSGVSIVATNGQTFWKIQIELKCCILDFVFEADRKRFVGYSWCNNEIVDSEFVASQYRMGLR